MYIVQRCVNTDIYVDIDLRVYRYIQYRSEASWRWWDWFPSRYRGFDVWAKDYEDMTRFERRLLDQYYDGTLQWRVDEAKRKLLPVQAPSFEWRRTQ